MKPLLTAVHDRLNASTGVTGVATVTHKRAPAIPEELEKYAVVTRLIGGPEAGDRGGAAFDPVVELKIWGHGLDWVDGAWDLAAELDDLMVEPLSISGAQRTSQIVIEGWEDFDNPDDPDEIHLQCRYHMRYWSSSRAARIAALT